MEEEFKNEGIAFNALWPKTAIATAAVQNMLGGDEAVAKSRNVDIMADAAYEILTKNSREVTGQFFVDEDVLKEAGVTDFKQYQIDPELDESELFPDFFL